MVKLLLTVLLAAYLPSSAFAANPPGKEDFDAATRLFNAEEYEAALPYFERAYTLSGRRPATVLALAQCLRALKRYEDAIARFEEYRPSATDNAKEIDETLALLTDLKKRQTEKAREEAEERAKSEERARQATAADRARAEEAEHQRSLEATAAAKALAETAAQRAAEEVARRVAKEAEDNARLVAPSPAPPEPEGGVLSSPIFWVLTGAAAVGGGLTAVYFATRSREDPYAGSSGVILVPGN